jgi:Protein of unknown function (DUF2892)
MKFNIGKTDRWIRVIVGVLIASLGLYFQSWWGLLSIILLGTAFINYCPLYSIFGISTRDTSQKI